MYVRSVLILSNIIEHPSFVNLDFLGKINALKSGPSIKNSLSIQHSEKQITSHVHKTFLKFLSFHLFSKPPGIYHPTIFRSWELFSSPP